MGVIQPLLRLQLFIRPWRSARLVVPREPGLEREAVSWFSRVYPRTQRPDWPGPRPLDIIQV